MWETIIDMTHYAMMIFVEFACLPVLIFFSILQEFDFPIDEEIAYVWTVAVLMVAFPMAYCRVLIRATVDGQQGRQWARDEAYYETLTAFFWFMFRPTVWFYSGIFFVINFATDKVGAGVTFAINRALWWPVERWDNIKQQWKKSGKKKPTPIKIIP